MSAKKIKIRNWGIQTKIISLILIALSTIAVAAYFVRENERILRQTLLDLSSPESILPVVHDIISTLPEAENRLRFFALTDEYDYFLEYESLIDSIENNLLSLKDSVANDRFILSELDSVEVLLSQRKELIAEYIRIKEARENINFTDQALSTIKQGSLDTSVNKRQTSTRTVTVFDTIATVPKDSMPPKKKKGIFGRIKNIFSKDEKKEQKTEIRDSVIRAETSIMTDTSSIVEADSQRINIIESKLRKIKAQDIRSYSVLREQELNMLRNSSQLISQMTAILRRIEFSVNQDNKLKSSSAINNASESLRLIGYVSLIAFLLIILLMVLIIDSIRKINKYRRNLMLSNIQANELAKVKEEFLTNMSHEIRTPLNAIIGFSDQMVKTKLSGEQQKYLDAIRKSSRHLLDTVNDILDIARLTAGKFNIENVTFKLQDILDDVLPPFKLMAEEKGLYFRQECSIPPDDLYITGDPLRLRQILYNLLSNSVKFTSEGGIITGCKIEVSDTYVQAEFSVQDTGIGIEEENLKNIFEEFQQADSSMARRYGGSGLGLAISRRLARLQGGDIIVSSKPGEGSTFTFRIKLSRLAPGSPVTADISKPIVDVEALKGKKILIADDDKFNTLLAEIIGENLMMDIRIAEDGYQAQQVIEAEDFDLIMTDLQMPGLTGIELLRFIRSHKDIRIAHLPVIAFTANKFDRYDIKLTALGFNEVLQKPFDQEELIERIGYYLGASESDNARADLTVSDLSKEQDELPYNLDQVKVFTGGNPEQEINILKSFIQTANESTDHLWKAYYAKDYAGIKYLAHRLLTSYGHLKVNNSLILLEKLDQVDLRAVNENEIKETLTELQENNRQLIKQLRKEISHLPD